ncbi:thioredoxin [Verrucomicrobiales bacterium]|nr:thioredoxin [Verrucomicrobiales bacterium]
MKPVELNSTDFDQTVAKGTGVVLVDFHAEWCGPCKTMNPIIEKVAESQAGKAVVAKVDIDQAKDIAQRYSITSIPTLIVFRDGEAIQAARGVQTPAAIEQLIAQAKAA